MLNKKMKDKESEDKDYKKIERRALETFERMNKKTKTKGEDRR